MKIRILFLLVFGVFVNSTFGQIAIWDASSQSAYGTQGWTATTITTGISNSLGLTRGSSIATTPTAAGTAWGGSGGWETSATPLNNNGSVTFSITVSAGYTLSLTSIASQIRKSASGPASCVIQYSINAGAYSSAGTWSNTTATATGGANSSTLSSIPALQDLPAGTIVNFRITTFASSTGNWYLTGATALRIYGTISSAVVNPTVTTTTASLIATTTADSGGNVTADGGATVSARGVVWNTSAAPTIVLSTKTSNGTGTGSFTGNITGLTANTKYFYRAYATNSAGTGYGSESNFTTLHNAPGIGSGSNATPASIDVNWTAPASAGSETFTYEVEIANNTGFTGSTVASGIASGTLTKNFTGLASNTPYYFRVRAVNAGGNSAWSSTSGAYATLPAPKVSAQDGPWTTGATWVGGIAPSNGDDVTILHHVTSGAVTRNSGTATTIASGASLAVSGTYDNQGTTTVNGTFQLNSGGYAMGNNFVYGSTGSLNFNSTYGVDNTHVYWPTSNGPFNVSVLTGILTLNSGANRTVSGTFQTAGGVSLSATLTLNGTARINAGGYFSNAPVYGNASTLVYNTGSGYGRGNEWTTATSGAGYPNNVQLSTAGTTLNMGSTVAQCAGNLTIDVSTQLNTTSNILTTFGNVIANGTINLAGDFKTKGNWTVGASGSQVNNSKAVFFTGAATQTISKTTGGIVFFDYLIIDKTGSVQFDAAPNATDVTINQASGDFLQLLSGTLDLNGRELKMQTAGGGNILVKDGRTITSTVANAKLSFVNSKTVTSYNSSASDTLLIDTNVNVYVASSVNFGHNGTNTMTTINGLLQINSGGSVLFNSLTYGASSTLRFAAGGIYGNQKEWTANAAVATFPSSGFPNNVEITNATTLDVGANGSSLTAKATNGYLTIEDGSKLDLAGSSAMTKPLTVKGDFTIGTSGTATVALSTASTADLYLGADIYFNGTYQFFPNNRAIFFTKNGTQKITASSTPTIPYIVFQPASGNTTVQLNGTDLIVSAPNTGNAISFRNIGADVFDLNGRTLTIGTNSVANTVFGTAGSFKGTAASNMILLGSGSAGTLNFYAGFENLGTLTVNRQPGTGAFTLGTSLTINTSLVLTNGLVSLGANVLTIGGSATTSGASSNSYVIADLAGTSGTIRKNITATGSFTFPIGDRVLSDDGSEFTPATVDFTSGSFTSAYITVGVKDIKHPSNAAPTDYITRYWSVVPSGTFTSPQYDFTGKYTTTDIAGTQTNSNPGRHNGADWANIGAGTISSNTLSLTGLTILSAINDFSAGNPLTNAEIDVKGNAVSITSGDAIPSAADHTDFGTTIYGTTVVRTFTIYNTGVAPLSLTANPAPQVTISGSSAFAVTAQPSSDVITYNNSLTFQITYTGGAFTAQDAVVSIANSDANENPYTFTITGIATPSSASDIIANAGYSYNSNIAYASYQAAAITNTSNSVDLFKFDFRDGGGTADTDALPTILNAITFNVTSTTMIRSAALFNGNALVNASPVINTGAGTIAFSGLSGANVTAADNGSNGLTLRVTFLAAVTDNTQFQVTIASANATAAASNASSLFGAFTSVVSSTTSDRNRIEVTADRLAFVQQPGNATTGTTMSPSPTVAAVDANGNRDLDYTAAISITNPTGTMTGDPISVAASNGLSTFSVVHTSAGTYTLNASSGSLTGIGSSSFIISSFAVGTYFSKTGGVWSSSAGNNTATWQVQTSGGAVDMGVGAYPPTNTSSPVYIANTVTLNGTNTCANVIIDNGGTLNTNTVAATFTNLTVKSGGTFNKESNSFTINGTLEVEDNGTFTFKHTNGTSLTTSVWKGTEKFHPNSNFIIKTVDNTSNSLAIEDKDDVSEYLGACFGNVIVDVSAGQLQLLPANFTKTLTNGNLIFRNNIGNLRISNGSYSTTIKGNLLIESTYSYSITQLTTAGTSAITINGDLIHGGTAAFRLTNNNNATLNATLNVLGNVGITNTNGVIDLNGDNNSANASTSILNIGGDLSVGASSILKSSCSYRQGTLNFNGTGNGLTAATTQTISVASTDATRNQYIDYFTNAGSYVQLTGQNFDLGKNSTFTVNGSGSTGSVLDFNFNGITPLNITSYSTGTQFKSEQAATLKISSVDGISATSGTVGNVQTTTAPAYNSVGIFHYVGKNNQVPGTGLPTASSAKFVIIELADNTKTFTLSGNVGISSGTTLDPLGGKLDIRKGIVIGTTSADFTGSGRLVMSDGEYKISTITASPLTNLLPQLSGYSKYALTGGTVHLSGSNAIQILSGSPSYYNFTTSGTNVLNTDYKGISSGAGVSNSIKITENSIVNVKSSALGGNSTTFTMTGNSRYITDGGGDKPDAGGAYTLDLTSTIEFANASGAGIVRLGPNLSPIYYAKVVVSGTNVSNESSVKGVKFQTGGSFTVNDNAVFKLKNTAGFTGSAATAIDTSTNGGPTITLATGSKIEYAAASPDVQTITPFGSYSDVGVSGTGTKILGSTAEVLIGRNLSVTAGTLQIDGDRLLTVTDAISSIDNAIIVNNNGSLVQINDAAIDSGKINATRTSRTMSENDYIYWGSPVQGDVVGQIPAVFDASYGWVINGAQDGYWDFLSSTAPGLGFITRIGSAGTSNFNFNGVPNNGIINVAANSFDDGATVEASGNTILLSNPYPCALDAKKFIDENSGSLEGTLYFWTSTTPITNNVYTPNDYASWNFSGGTTTGGSGLTPTGKIGTGQGFFANLKSDGGIVFKNLMRVHDVATSNSQFFRNSDTGPSEPEYNRIWLNISNPDNAFRQALVGYITDATNGYDSKFDGYNFTDNAINISSLLNNKAMVIQGRTLPFDVNDLVPLSIKIPTAGSNTIAIDHMDGLFTEGQNIYLQDNLLNIIHDLKAAPYTFDSEQGTFNDRFVLRYTNGNLDVTDIDYADGIAIIKDKNQLKVKSQTETIAKIIVFDLLGRQVFEKDQINSNTFFASDIVLNQQTLIIKVTLANGTTVTKKVIF